MTPVLSKAATCGSNTAGRREITVGLLHWRPISSAGRLQSLLPSAGILVRLPPKAPRQPQPRAFPSPPIQTAPGWVPNRLRPPADLPAATGFRAQRPGGNLTGNSGFQAELEPKRLGLLRELRPDETTIGVLVNPNVAYIDAQLIDIRSAAADIGREIVILNASTIAEIDAAFVTL